MLERYIKANAPMLQEAGWNVSNVSEIKVAESLVRMGYKPAEVETQFKLGPYRIDFALVKHAIAIEADGWVHTTERTKRKDRERDWQLRKWGWRTIRVNTEELSGHELDAFLEVELTKAYQTYRPILSDLR